MPDETDDEPLTTEEWLLVILLGLLILGAVAAIAAMLSRGSKGRNDVVNSRQMRLDDITRMSRSVHDSSVPSVLRATDPAAVQSAWATTQHQLVDLEARVAQLATDVSDTDSRRAVQELGTASIGVRGALESHVGLRLGDASSQADLIDASNRTVLHRSDQLEAALQRVLYVRL